MAKKFQMMERILTTSDSITLSPEQLKTQIDKIIKPSLEYFKPPEKLTLSEWADKKKNFVS